MVRPQPAKAVIEDAARRNRARPGEVTVFYPLLLLLALLATGCSKSAGADQNGGQDRKPVPVVVSKAVVKSMPVQLEAVGQVLASSTVSVTSQVTGRVDKVHFSEGDEIDQNQILFTIDPRPYAVNLKQAQARLEQNRNLSAQAQLDAERAAKLADAGLVAKKELEQASANALALGASVAADQAAVQGARLDLQYSVIRSPLSGRAGALLIHAGNVVRANAEAPLVVIRRTKPVWVSFAIPDSHLATVRQRMQKAPLTILAKPRGPDAVPVTGTVYFVSNSVDSNTGTIELRAEVKNQDEALWPGQQVDVKFLLSQESNATVIPEAAIQLGQDGSSVYVVTTDGVARLRQVRVDRTVDNESVIQHGLTPGESVVVDGQMRLVDGARVVVREQASPAAASAAAAQSAARP